SFSTLRPAFISPLFPYTTLFRSCRSDCQLAFTRRVVVEGFVPRQLSGAETGHSAPGRAAQPGSGPGTSSRPEGNTERIEISHFEIRISKLVAAVSCQWSATEPVKKRRCKPLTSPTKLQTSVCEHERRRT